MRRSCRLIGGQKGRRAHLQRKILPSDDKLEVESGDFLDDVKNKRKKKRRKKKKKKKREKRKNYNKQQQQQQQQQNKKKNYTHQRKTTSHFAFRDVR